jgi:hypothetical protein
MPFLRLWVSDSPNKWGDRGKKNDEIIIQAPSMKEGVRSLAERVEEKYGIPRGTPVAPVRMGGRRKSDPLELYFDSPEKIHRIRRRRGEL